MLELVGLPGSLWCRIVRRGSVSGLSATPIDSRDVRSDKFEFPFGESEHQIGLLEVRFDVLEVPIDPFELRIDALEVRIDKLRVLFHTIEDRIAKMGVRFSMAVEPAQIVFGVSAAA